MHQALPTSAFVQSHRIGGITFGHGASSVLCAL
jgi:hypothetical protein